MNLELIRSKSLRSILMFSIPSIIAMVLTSLITIVDGFFVGNYVGESALAAINFGLPILYFYLAIGLMISVGGIAIGGMALGRAEQNPGNLKKCKNIFNQTIVVTLIATTIVSIIVLCCFNPIMRLLQVAPEAQEYFRSYYMVMLVTFPLMVLNSNLGMFVRGEGKPQFAMMINLLNVVCNIVLDYIFVKQLSLGVAGIAYASLISVIIGTICMMLFILKKAKVFRFGRFKFDGKDMRSILLNGSSEFVGELSMSISMFAYNFMIMRYVGLDGVAAFTIVGYISYIFSMILIGFGQGMSPLVSFTYGARETELAVKLRKQTNTLVFVTGAIFAALMFLFASKYTNLFVENANVTQMAESGVRIFVISFLFAGINTISSMYFTSIGKARESAIISMARSLVFLLIAIFTLPQLFGMTGVWLVGPITEVATLIISIVFIVKSRVQPQVAETEL